jgi:hypothetical protein
MTTLFVMGLLVLAPAVPPVEAEEDPSHYISLVESYLDLLDHMRETAADPRSALVLAQSSIKEIYEKKGQKLEAATELRKILDGLTDPAARTALRFTISDIYKEAGQMDRSLEELRLIVSENKSRLAQNETPPAAKKK